jgi:hypothetical protein
MGLSRSLSCALVAIIAGCGGDDGGRDTAASRCDIGGRPDYFVPGGEAGPLAIIGCARLGVSGKPVEFSLESERIGRKDHVCFNPAYRGRGRLGMYIPTACVLDPGSRRLDVVSIEVPSQGVRDYGLVIWGTVGPSIRTVHAGYDGRETRAAVFPVRRPTAHAVGATRPFGVFVVELHPKPTCARVWARTRMGEITKLAEYRPRLCP